MIVALFFIVWRHEGQFPHGEAVSVHQRQQRQKWDHQADCGRAQVHTHAETRSTSHQVCHNFFFLVGGVPYGFNRISTVCVKVVQTKHWWRDGNRLRTVQANIVWTALCRLDKSCWLPVAGCRTQCAPHVSTANQSILKSAVQISYKMLASQNGRVLDREGWGTAMYVTQMVK